MTNNAKRSWRNKLSQVVLGATVAVGAAQCAPTEGYTLDPNQKTFRLTLIHTSDIHSRLFPYQYTPLLPDKNAGLLDGKGPYGGIARMAYVAKRERARSDRSLHIDGGDVLQGAPVFNYFNGEAEIRALSEMGIDAMVIANHEFDRGALNVYLQLSKWATFPVLAANYKYDDPSVTGNSVIGGVLRPYTILNARGVRVAVIGMGNLSTLTSLFEQPNRLGLMPYSTRQITQFYVDFLRTQADIVVAVTHLGLEVDERMIQETEGLDVVLGGHNHIVVSPPKVVYDCGGKDVPEAEIDVPDGSNGGEGTVKRKCRPRRVLLMHSGAFTKFLGRLDLEISNKKEVVDEAYGGVDHYDPVNGFEVIAHQQKIVPIDNEIPEDRPVAALLEPYKQTLKDIGNLDLLVGYAPADVRRSAPNGGDSQLGNLIATSMWLRLGVQTDFSMTNTTGIRSDLPKGAITLEQMFNVFPFDNSVSKMQLSGSEVYEMFDFIALRSSRRACVSQVQIAGAYVAYNCNGCGRDFRSDHDPLEACAEQVFIGYTSEKCAQDTDCSRPADTAETYARFSCDKRVGRCRNRVSKVASYELATSNYLAGGGSGFRVLQRNTTQFDTKIQQRDAVTDFVRVGRPCGFQVDKSSPTGGGLIACMSDSDCQAYGDFVCACPGNAEVVDATSSAVTCKSRIGCTADVGRCVLAECRNDVATFQDNQDCKGLSGDKQASCRTDSCSLAGEKCKILACLDGSIGAAVDGRQVMLGR